MIRAAQGWASRRVFTDSAAYLATADENDAMHQSAIAIAQRIEAERYRRFFSNLVLTETHAFIIRRIGHRTANGVLFELDNSRTVVVRVSARDERRAREILRQYADKAWSLTDATSFAVMERLHITRAFTFDSDFAQYGFTVLAP
ncbi:MAG: type II toxin-antitoxin system VapC family toxin [Dehalococcoidia bacterium]